MADFTSHRKIIIEFGDELDPPRFAYEAPPGSDLVADLAAAGNVLNFAGLPADSPEERQRQIDAWWHRMAAERVVAQAEHELGHHEDLDAALLLQQELLEELKRTDPRLRPLVDRDERMQVRLAEMRRALDEEDDDG